jgi:hypothetical protein
MQNRQIEKGYEIVKSTKFAEDSTNFVEQQGSTFYLHKHWW